MNQGEIRTLIFVCVKFTEGYEVKGLKWPGRDSTYDSNSQVPTGYHNGREIFYVFGRYPADLAPYRKQRNGRRQYPVVDLVICHGNFLNADHGYVHKNKSVKGFGTYGDIMIRDRKMYVAPTPFALTDGTTGLKTLIVPESIEPDTHFQDVGRLTRVEAPTLVVGYTFDLRTNELNAERIPNPDAGANMDLWPIDSLVMHPNVFRWLVTLPFLTRTLEPMKNEYGRCAGNMYPRAQENFA